MSKPLQDSIGPDKGSKDCRTCMLRRIRCDRTLPSCLKCAKHERYCPGYGLNIRWTNAIASRRTNQRISHLSNSASSEFISTPHRPSAMWEGAVVLLTESILNAPNASRVAAMVKHYNDSIAGRMVWVDSDQNPYRQLVIPLSRSQPILLLAILAVSDEHEAFSRGSTSDFASRAHDVVIEKITHELQKLTDGGGQYISSKDIMDITSAEWILATILILHNYECVRLSSSAWRLHRHGARTLINSVTSSNGTSSRLFNFLRDQFSISDVLASTTTHLYMNSDDVVLPEPHSTNMFSEYLQLVHQVDLGSRKSPALELHTKHPEVLRMEFEMARGSTLLNAGKSYDLSSTSSRELIFLADVYHHAALLYSYRLLGRLSSTHPDVIAASNAIFERFEQFKSWPKCAHNLPWPVFIAGIESYHNGERQRIVSDMLNTILVETGFSNTGTISKFLKTFWSGAEINWLEVLEKWEARGNYLLAV